MLEPFQRQFSDNFPMLTGKRLLVAVSGGVDSMVLAELLRLSETKFSIAHCNFTLRGAESDADEVFVTDYSNSNKIKVHTTRFDTEAFANDYRLSIQLAARKLRYEWFEELCNLYGYDFILTAHHLDDSIETFLINLGRGTGLDGLTGIPQQNGKIIRPLLGFTRQQVIDFATEHQIGWREDSSNSQEKYLRNKIRHQVVPILKEASENFDHAFSSTLRHLKQAGAMQADAAALVYKQVAIEKDDKIIFKIFDLKRLPDYTAYLYYWLRDFRFSAWDDIYELVDAQSGKQIFGKGFVLIKDREVLILSKIGPTEEMSYDVAFSGNRGLPLEIEFENVTELGTPADNRIFADAGLLHFPLKLRKWHEGDYFYPFGMAGKKKVSKYFKDEKFSLPEKNNTWILASGEEILWIIGHRQDDRFKVTDKTKKIVQITIS